MNTSARLPGWKQDEFWRSGIVLHCLLYFPHHKHAIKLQWYSFKSCEAMMGAKVIIFGVRPPELVPWIVGLFSYRKPGWNFTSKTKTKFVPVTGLTWRGPKVAEPLCNKRPRLTAVSKYKEITKYSKIIYSFSFENKRFAHWILFSVKFKVRIMTSELRLKSVNNLNF